MLGVLHGETEPFPGWGYRRIHGELAAGVTWRRPGVPAPAVRRNALASAAAGSASRGGRDERRSSRTAARSADVEPVADQVSAGRSQGRALLLDGPPELTFLKASANGRE